MAQSEIEERAEAAEKARKAEKIDFKMVTFSLAGKEYGIDIMSVKEIAKAGRFTYVPNAAPFVRGVYNLRGDIISVIDMRIFFHLPAERKEEEALESLIILRVGEQVFGIIVDGIDKVVGISQASIQPPHPIFGDINVKYIKGIVENAGKLYIILDVDRIFAPERETERAADEAAALARPSPRAAPEEAPGFGADVASSFVKETLAALRGFHVGPTNEAWFASRFAEWKAGRKGADLQIKEASEADQFLEGFWSPATGRLWDDDYAQAVEAVLPEIEAKSINVWNPGCGKGYETWSLACVLRKRYPETRIKVWANDSDLLAISMAPNMVFPEAVPDYYVPFMTKGKNGLSFVQAVRDSIFFEYHDVMNANPLPPLDMILCRDMLSFLAPIDQKRLFGDFIDKLKPSGVVLTGLNERLGEGWTPFGTEAVPAFRKD
ncbi:MAG TPA: chemotaxis protein CheW [Spirochaetales bacterium]|nr:chemotaxis protein CheW [Spirochaetales bacterium]HRY53886.1 chemotaxis protein CheW [Spirochaetia bacterium]HRZ64257.1 chemotaxis protein CheW [Spirochaetia bacterium]